MSYTKYQNLAMKILGSAPETFLLVFFHDDNVNYVAANVLESTSVNDSGILTQKVFFKMIHVYNNTLGSSRRDLKGLLTENNRHVVKETVVSIRNGVKRFSKYKQDFLKGNPEPLPRPEYKVSIKGPFDSSIRAPWNPQF